MILSNNGQIFSGLKPVKRTMKVTSLVFPAFYIRPVHLIVLILDKGFG